MKRPRVLVADDQLEMARTLADALEDAGYDAVAVGSGKTALAELEKDDFDAVVTDLRMPDISGLEVMAAAQAGGAERPVLIMTAFGAIDSAIESIRKGAYHYLTKPFKNEELLIFLGRALEEVRLRKEASSLRHALGVSFAKKHIISESPAMKSVLELVERVAGTQIPVLITGETGTGKGLVARAIHAEGPRARGPLVTINCAAMPENLLESELFGHVRGAFTGAVASRPGLFAEASGGTLFLDEIGELPLALQAKLLGALERGVVRPVGAEKEVAVDVRIISATNRNLREGGGFREDLLYRIDGVTIEVPPLRHRPEDILPLAAHFLAQAHTRHPQSPVLRLSAEAAEALVAYDWPGNVRELEHIIERAVVLGRSPDIARADLPPARKVEPVFQGQILPVRELQRRYAAWALAQNGGHKGKTAAALGIDEKTLAAWLANR